LLAPLLENTADDIGAAVEFGRKTAKIYILEG